MSPGQEKLPAECWELAHNLPGCSPHCRAPSNLGLLVEVPVHEFLLLLLARSPVPHFLGQEVYVTDLVHLHAAADEWDEPGDSAFSQSFQEPHGFEFFCCQGLLAKLGTESLNASNGKAVILFLFLSTGRHRRDVLVGIKHLAGSEAFPYFTSNG